MLYSRVVVPVVNLRGLILTRPVGLWKNAMHASRYTSDISSMLLPLVDRTKIRRYNVIYIRATFLQRKTAGTDSKERLIETSFYAFLRYIIGNWTFYIPYFEGMYKSLTLDQARKMQVAYCGDYIEHNHFTYFAEGNGHN